MRSKAMRLACFFLTILIAAVSADAARVKGRGAVSTGSVTEVEYDHLNDPPYVEYKIKLSDGEMFGITILKTLPNRFDYEVEAIARPTPQIAAAAGVLETDLVPYQITRVHDRQYAGYVVHIKPKDGVAIAVTRNDQSADSLGTAELRISVATMEVDYEMSGAFTATGLRDPVFAIEKRTEDEVEQQFVVRDRDAEDDQDLGMGAFIHVFHTRMPWLAGTFGLGINDGNRTTYFAGPTWRVGNKAALTVGLAAGSVSRLPAGVSVGDRITDANVLTNAGTRMDRSWFVGFSYTFLNPGNALKKPFAGEGNVPAAPAVPQAPVPPIPQGQPQGVPPAAGQPPSEVPNSQPVNPEPDPFVKPKPQPKPPEVPNA